MRHREKWWWTVLLVVLACSGRSKRSTEADGNEPSAGESSGGSQSMGGSANDSGGSEPMNGGGGSTAGAASPAGGGSTFGGNGGTVAGGGRTNDPAGSAGAGAMFGGAGSGGSGVLGGAGSSGSGFGVGCFERGSSVATPRGSVAIETLVVGDKVLAFDERSGRVVPRAVSATYVHTVAQSGRLRLTDGRELRVTAEHPVFLVDRGRYARADEVHDESTLLSLTSSATMVNDFDIVALGTESTSHGFVAIDRTTVVYNISVEDLENYFVEGVLVHNKSGAGPVGGMCNIPTWSSDDCNTHPTCLDYEESGTEMVAADQDAPDGTGSLHIDVTTCSAPPTESRLVGVDVWLATPQSSQPGFVLFSESEACMSSSHQGEIRVPYTATTAGWTTQCIRTYGNSTGSRFAIVSLDGTTLVKNPRLVQSCECIREVWGPTVCVGDTQTSDCE